MPTFDALSVGDRFSSGTRMIDEDTLRATIGLGGYVHRIFTDPEFVARTPMGRTPLPGEAVLLIIGGLAEQTGRFDDTTIALVGFDQVRFVAPVFAGDDIRLDVEVTGKEPSRATGVLVMQWTCIGSDGSVRCEAVARMLFRTV
jgi:acyl dehydratase